MDCCQWTSVTPCFEVGPWDVVMLWLVCHWHMFFFPYENHCMLWELERNHGLHTLGEKSLIFPAKKPEYLIHIQSIHTSGGAKWDVLFLGIVERAPSTLPIPSSWTQWIWANAWRSLWLEEPLGTEDQHGLYSQVYCLHWGSAGLKAGQVRDYLT